MCVEGGHNHSGAIKILKVLSVYNDLVVCIAILHAIIH